MIYATYYQKRMKEGKAEPQSATTTKNGGVIIMSNIFEIYPIGSTVKYVGGDDTAKEMGIEVGDTFVITENDDLGFLGEVAGFSVNGGDDDFFAIANGSGLIPDNTESFEAVSK